jgi:phosphomannomutase
MTAPAPLIVSISGIRGVVDESLTTDVVQRFAAAFATSLKPSARVVLARDTRASGGRFASEITPVLQQAGCHVLDLGVCSTPGAKLMVIELGADGAVIITASHNPNPWNGLKLIRDDGIFLTSTQGQRVVELFERGQFRQIGGGSLTAVDPKEVSRRHLGRLLRHVDVELVRGAGLAAAVDPCNGAGAILMPDLLAALGVRATMINAAPDGRFAHEPEPLPANLADLGAAVRNSASHVGFAIDPDADRVALVDGSGQPVGEDYTLALAVDSVVARRPGPVVTTLSTSQTVTDAARRHGCPVLLTAVGEVNVVEKMLEVEAAIGGEGNGGVILTQVHPGRDAAVGVAVILEALARTRLPLSALVRQLPSYCIEKRKISATPAQVARTVRRLQERYPGAYLHPVPDGAKLYLAQRYQCPWIHLRPSNTEPVVRIIAESASADESQRLCDESEQLLGVA